MGEIAPFIFLFSIFVMAIFVGYYVVWSVTPALHTPLMAVTNAVSSVIIVGAVTAVGVEALSDGATVSKWLGFGAVVLASSRNACLPCTRKKKSKEATSCLRT